MFGKSKMDISIIIVSYNSEDTIYDCMNSVLKTVKDNSFEIIVSDNSKNGKTESIVKKIVRDNKNVFYLKNEENLGFSKANNRAVKSSRGKYILFLNPDTKVYEQTIDGMVSFLKKNPDCGVATCYVELPSGKLDGASHRGFPTPWRSFSHFSGLSKIFSKSKVFSGYYLTYLDFKKTHEIDSAAGSFMFVPRTVGEKIGWWDEDFFFYGEDIDFCYRVKKTGYKVYFVPEFKALHLKGVSSGIKKESKDITKATRTTKNLATYHRFKAMEIFYDKHYKDRYPWLVNFIVKLGIKLKKRTV